MPVFANEPNKDTDSPLVLKLDATSKSLDGIRTYLNWAAGAMQDWAKWSDEECRQKRLPLTTGSVGFSTSCNVSIDRVGRTTSKGLLRGIGILVLLIFAAIGVANLSSLRSGPESSDQPHYAIRRTGQPRRGGTDKIVPCSLAAPVRWAQQGASIPVVAAGPASCYPAGQWAPGHVSRRRSTARLP
jgi:hypothetical protein